ncbi:hypothetical protein Esti_003681 [Eimeria stiedai]
MVCLPRVQAESRTLMGRQHQQVLGHLRLSVCSSDKPRLHQGILANFLRQHLENQRHSSGLHASSSFPLSKPRVDPAGASSLARSRWHCYQEHKNHVPWGPLTPSGYGQQRPASFLRRRGGREEGGPLLAGSCLRHFNSRGPLRSFRRFLSSTDIPEPGHVVLSKERLDQLLLAEITEFALRPSRPLTLEQIAFLNETQQQPHHHPDQQQQTQSHGSSSSSSTPSRQGTHKAVPDARHSRHHQIPSRMQAASASCRAVLGPGDDLTGKVEAPLWNPSRGPLGTGANSFAEFLFHELPVRFASRVKQLESLPLFHTEPLIMQVRQTYVESFKQLRTSCVEDPHKFHQVVLDLKRRHAPIVPMVVTGIRNLREVAPQFFTEKFVDEFLDGFFLSRIGTEMLTSSYLTPNGVVDMGRCNNGECIMLFPECASDAERLCHSHYGTCPQIEIWNFNEAHFASVPQYLYYILSELLKNALRATMEHYPSLRAPGGDRSSSYSDSKRRSWPDHPDRCEAEQHSRHLARNVNRSKRSTTRDRHNQVAPHYRTANEVANPNMPPVQLLVAGDDHTISIRLSDMGGGIAADAQPRIWSYMYTTAKPVKYDPLSGIVMSAPPVQQLVDKHAESMKQSVTIGSLDFTTQAEKKELMASPLAGFGCGLPLCRLYASYLGGCLTIVSMPVYGTDAFVHLRRIGDQQELMPSNVWLKPNMQGDRPADSHASNHRVAPFGAPRP